MTVDQDIKTAAASIVATMLPLTDKHETRMDQITARLNDAVTKIDNGTVSIEQGFPVIRTYVRALLQEREHGKIVDATICEALDLMHG